MVKYLNDGSGKSFYRNITSRTYRLSISSDFVSGIQSICARTSNRSISTFGSPCHRLLQINRSNSDILKFEYAKLPIATTKLRKFKILLTREIDEPRKQSYLVKPDITFSFNSYPPFLQRKLLHRKLYECHIHQSNFTLTYA